MARIKEKINLYFMNYTNFIIFSVLSIFMLVQFTFYRNIVYTDLVHDAELKARVLANLVSGLNEMRKSSEISLNKKNEQLLKDEIQSLSKNGDNIVNLKIFRLDTRTNSWNQAFTINGSFDTVLSREEKGIATVVSRFFKNKKEIWFNGEGYVAEGTVYINPQSKLAIQVNANSFIQQQIWAALILALLLVSILIILILKYRLVFIRLYRPLNNLITGMQIISQGNMDYKIPVEERNELGRFIESFNCMVLELKNSREALEHELSVTKDQKEKIFTIYRDVIYAVTQGKFILVNDEELPSYIDDGKKLAEVNISKGEDIGLARQISKQAINNLFPQYDKTQKILLCVSEAATNIVKHAGSGLFIIKRMNDETIRFIFKDRGPGMDFDYLPSMLFYKGFSTKISLGSGFNIIYSFVDEMILSTSKKGTTVVFDM